ncbi:MAG: hypothetical protein BECKG1743E_GA0114224_102971, partial [Candidatus Kentron sp. G]
MGSQERKGKKVVVCIVDRVDLYAQLFFDELARGFPDFRMPWNRRLFTIYRIGIDIMFLAMPFQVLRPSKFEGHRPTIRHGCRMALMVA